MITANLSLFSIGNNFCMLHFLKARYVIIQYKKKRAVERSGGRVQRVKGDKGPARREERSGLVLGNKAVFCTILLVNFVLIFKKTIANITNLSKYEDFVVD